EAEFLRVIADDPDDEATRAAYADWLEENGREQMALYLRLDLERARTHRTAERFEGLTTEMAALEQDLDVVWAGGLGRPGGILNCGSSAPNPILAFRFLCPNRWSDLKETSLPGVRYCGDCRQTVSLCEDAEEATRRASEGACIAITSRIALAVLDKLGPDESAEFDGLMVGMPALPRPMSAATSPTPEQPPPTPPKPWWQFW